MSSIIYMFNIAVSVSIINYIFFKMIDDMVWWYHSDEK